MKIESHKLLSRILFAVVISFVTLSCQQKEVVVQKQETPFVWEGANVYFLLVDRFNNGDTTNDNTRNSTDKTAVLRGFEGGDLQGVIQKIESGYFDELGINALWLTPVVEQIKGSTDEGTGLTQAYHGYWTSDWTSIEPNLGTKEDLANLVKVAHEHGIKVLLDAVVNHTGPVTDKDAVWPADWVRTNPACTYSDYETTVSCTLVENLPEILTESDTEVELPEYLVEKWKSEGRYEEELAELDDFFAETGYPRAPRFYIMKWLSDYISDYGIDGYRVDTVKHVEESVWSEFKEICDRSFDLWKKSNPEQASNSDFYLIGEVYNYIFYNGKNFDFGDRKVDYFDQRFDALINFEFKYNAEDGYEKTFSRYSDQLNGEMSGYSVMNYLDSHDDGSPFDPDRTRGLEAGTKLLLSPGISQVYYGDESNRGFSIEGAQGDANLRSNMNWEDLENSDSVIANFSHWSKLGKFRRNHMSVGAGMHTMLQEAPYVFSRTYTSDSFEDRVVVGLDFEAGSKLIEVKEVFEDGAILRDAYSNQTIEVIQGKVEFDSPFSVILLEKI